MSAGLGILAAVVIGTEGAVVVAEAAASDTALPPERSLTADLNMVIELCMYVSLCMGWF